MNGVNINGLTTLLLELAYQGSGKISPAAKAEGVARIRDATVAGKRVLEGADTGPPTGQSTRAETKQTAEQPVHPPAFTPLPLRSDLFREARFFARLGEEKAGATAPREPATEIFICLVTENLGRVWVGLSCRSDFLSVKYFTDNEPTSKILKENFPPLRENLKEIGFIEISLTSRARAELGAVVEGLLPRFEEHLLDRKI